MFFVFNKSKIYSYLIALSTVLVLFVAAAKLNEVVSPTNQIIETSTNVIEGNQIENGVRDITKNIILSE